LGHLKGKSNKLGVRRLLGGVEREKDTGLISCVQADKGFARDRVIFHDLETLREITREKKSSENKGRRKIFRGSGSEEGKDSRIDREMKGARSFRVNSGNEGGEKHRTCKLPNLSKEVRAVVSRKAEGRGRKVVPSREGKKGIVLKRCEELVFCGKKGEGGKRESGRASG